MKDQTLHPRAIKNGKVFRIAPNCSYDLQGVIASLKISEDQLLQAYNDVSEARAKLEKVGEIEKLPRDKEDYLRTARQLLNEKYNGQ